MTFGAIPFRIAGYSEIAVAGFFSESNDPWLAGAENAVAKQHARLPSGEGWTLPRAVVNDAANGTTVCEGEA